MHEAQLFSFSSSPSNAWLPIDRSAKRAKSEPAKLRCKLYNLWSGERRLRDNRLAEAWRLLFNSSEQADIVAIHEVSAVAEKSLRRNRAVRERFMVTSLDEWWEAIGRREASSLPEGEDQTGSVLLVRKHAFASCSASFVAFSDTSQARGCILLEAGSLRLATAQYESNTHGSGSEAPTRASQYSQTRDMLDHDGPRILLADANHNRYEDEIEPFLDEYDDAWMSLHLGDDPLRANPTFGALVPYFNSKRNETRKVKRIDLALIAGLRCDAASTFGDRPIRDWRGNLLRYHLGRDGHCFASDHLGLAVTLSFL